MSLAGGGRSRLAFAESWLENAIPGATSVMTRAGSGCAGGTVLWGGAAARAAALRSATPGVLTAAAGFGHPRPLFSQHQANSPSYHNAIVLSRQACCTGLAPCSVKAADGIEPGVVWMPTCNLRTYEARMQAVPASTNVASITTVHLVTPMPLRSPVHRLLLSSSGWLMATSSLLMLPLPSPTQTRVSTTSYAPRPSPTYSKAGAPLRRLVRPVCSHAKNWSQLERPMVWRG
mmetsp:Transcript_25138/g.63751  ORF Transcript_25138/g.63751 Transcript_25138/m.63751 type:complete len:232 (-) Transcript_25138:77-772(-)